MTGHLVNRRSTPGRLAVAERLPSSASPPSFRLQARLFAAAGVDKIRLTGGEPTLRADLVDITAGLHALPGVRAVGLTSNGLTLGRKLPALKEAGAEPPGWTALGAAARGVRDGRHR